MNSKLYIFIFFLIGCGVKGDPISPQTTPLPSLIDNYPDIELEKKIEDQRKLD